MELKKEWEENDIYFMEVLEDKLIINDNYNGISVYDSSPNLIKTIEFMDGFLIESSVKKGNEIMLICPENGSLVYLS